MERTVMTGENVVVEFENGDVVDGLVRHSTPEGRGQRFELVDGDSRYEILHYPGLDRDVLGITLGPAHRCERDRRGATAPDGAEV